MHNFAESRDGHQKHGSPRTDYNVLRFNDVQRDFLGRHNR